MAEINLGNIKFNWKGAYAGGTAYVVDDVVSSAGSSYVCILASTGNTPPNGTYWNLMAEAGTDTSVLTTQGDVLYRDASGLQRLAAGTSGNVLTTKGSGQNPTWEAASGGKVLQYVSQNDNIEYSNNPGTTPTDIQGSAADLTITPSSTASRILVNYSWGVIQFYDNSAIGYGVIRYNVGGGSFGDVTPTGANTVAGSQRMHFGINLPTAPYQTQAINFSFIHHPNTTSEVKYRPFYWGEASNSQCYINRSQRNGANDFSGVMMASAMELE